MLHQVEAIEQNLRLGSVLADCFRIRCPHVHAHHLEGATAAPGEGKLTGLAVEVDAGNHIFTTLPVVPVEESMSRE